MINDAPILSQDPIAATVLSLNASNLTDNSKNDLRYAFLLAFQTQLTRCALFSLLFQPISLLLLLQVGELKNALSNLQQQSIGWLLGADENFKLARTFLNLTCQIDQPEPNRFEPLPSPTLWQDQTFHGGIEVQGEDHDAPPGGIFSKISRGELAPSQVVFHDRVYLFAFATAFPIPPEQLVTVHISIGDDTPNLITLTAMSLYLVRFFGCFASGEFQLIME